MTKKKRFNGKQPGGFASLAAAALAFGLVFANCGGEKGGKVVVDNKLSYSINAETVTVPAGESRDIVKDSEDTSVKIQLFKSGEDFTENTVSIEGASGSWDDNDDSRWYSDEIALTGGKTVTITVKAK